MSGTGFQPVSTIGNILRYPTAGAAGAELFSMAATGAAGASGQPSRANDFSAFAILGTPQTQTNLSNCDAIVQRGGVEFGFASYNPTDSALVKAQSVQAAFNFAIPGDVVTIEPGTYDFGRGGPYLLPPCLVKGSGRGVTILTSEKTIDADGVTPGQGQGVSFALQEGTILEDCTLITTPWTLEQDGGCVGFLSTTTNAHAIVERCEIQANDWAVYNWSAGNSLILADSTVTSGRICIAAENSGVGQNFYLVRCNLIGDASLSRTTGATSDQTTGGVFGVVARGGRTQLVDCNISLKGRASTAPSWTPRTCGVTDSGGANDSPASVDQIVLWNLSSSIDPNGCDPAKCFDLDLKYPYVQAQLQVTHGSGSAPDGTLSKSWSSPSIINAVDTGDALGAVAAISSSATTSLTTIDTRPNAMTNSVSSGSPSADGTLESSQSPILQPLKPMAETGWIVASSRHLVSLTRDPPKDRRMPEALHQPIESSLLFSPEFEE